ncbi:MAG: succinate dehydrogenase, hydrophobic membrane anchor protein [Gammaproteobacteria bacterium]
MSLRTPLSEAKGLGSAKEGAGHWWLQRLTAVALIPLVIWLAFGVATLGDASYETVLAWLQKPHVSVLLILFVVATFYHTQLGLQVIIEDYVHGWLKVVTLILINFLCIVLAVVGIVALLKIFL